MNISTNKLNVYRKNTYYLNKNQNLRSLQDAVNFVNKRGFIYFWPIKGVEMPSLWTAVAGRRPVASAHNDPGHVTWSWKDDSLGKRIWYYGKVLRKKATIISLETAPFFYALSRNFGDPVEDIQIDFLDGRISKEAWKIFNLVHQRGPLDTVAIRKATNMTSKRSNYAFDRALSLLQSDFKILPVGISDSGGWRYAFIYDLVQRHFPQIPAQAHQISENHARKHILGIFFRNVGMASLRDTTRLFHWDKEHILRAAYELMAEGIVFIIKDHHPSEVIFAVPDIIQ